MVGLRPERTHRLRLIPAASEERGLPDEDPHKGLAKTPPNLRK